MNSPIHYTTSPPISKKRFDPGDQTDIIKCTKFALKLMRMGILVGAFKVQLHSEAYTIYEFT